MSGDGEGKADLHTGGVALHRDIDKGLDLGKGDDLVESGTHLGLGHAQDGTVEKNVFPSGQLWVKAGSDLQERSHTAPHGNAALTGLGDAGEDLQKRGLSRSIAADDAEDLARRHFERKMAQGPEFGCRGLRFLAGPELFPGIRHTRITGLCARH